MMQALSKSLGKLPTGSNPRFVFLSANWNWLAFVALSLAMTLEAYRYTFNTLMGDDLYNITEIASGNFPKDFWQALTAVYLEKHRPVFHYVIGQLYNTFGADAAGYLIVNKALYLITAWIAYIIAKNASGSALIGFIVAFCLLISRFALYQLWQVTGLVEGLAFFFIVFSVLLAQAGARNRNDFYIDCSIATWFLSILTHERYIALAPAALAFLLLSSKMDAKKAGARVVGIFFLIVALVAYKMIYSASGGLTGTGGAPLAFSVSRFMEYFLSAIANVSGFNFGPTYLSGEDMWEAALIVWLLSCLLCIAIWLPFILGLKNFLRRNAFISAIPLAAAFLCSVAVASITIRQEFRWLLLPQFFLLIGFAKVIGTWSRVPRLALIGTLGLLSVAQTLHYRTFDHRIFFFASQFQSENLARALHDVAKTTTQLNIFVTNPSADCNWMLGSGRWFSYPWSGGVANITRANCLGAQDWVEKPEGSKVAWIMSSSNPPQAIVDQTGRLSLSMDLREISSADNSQSLWTIKGRSIPEGPVSSPSGKGSFISEGWTTDLGPSPAIIVVSGFRHEITLPNYTILSDLSFGYGMAYPTTASANLRVITRSLDGIETIIWKTVADGPKDSIAQITKAHVSLNNTTIKAIVFEVDSVDPGNNTAQWGVFVYPSIRLTTSPISGASTMDNCSSIKGVNDGRSLLWCQSSAHVGR